MARLYRDLGTRTVVLSSGRNRGKALAEGMSAILYSDADGTVLANLAEWDSSTPDTPGVAVAGAALTIDAYSDRPAFWDLDDLENLYITTNGGPLEAIYPDAQPQITALAERVTDVEAGGAGDALLVHKAGPETIAGVKTFSAEPAVPTPTVGTSPTTKTYVDAADAAEATARATGDTAAIATAAADATTKANAAQAAAIAAAATDATTKVVAEATTRAAADTTLSGLITTEATSRAAADTAAIATAAADATTKANAAQAAAIAASNQRASNLSDVANATTARGNLGVPPAYANTRYVSDYIPAGTDTTSTDCYSYIMLAVAAAGVGGKIVFNGRFRCDTEIALLNYQLVSGLIDWLGSGSGLNTTCVDFRQVSANAGEGNTKVGFRNAASNRFEDLLIDGPGYSVANSRAVSGLSGSTTSPRFKNVSFYNWEQGVHLENAFYSDFIDCSWQANAVGIYANLCYNVTLYKPRMKCTDGTNYGTGVQVVGFIRGLKIFGGSIEDFATGITGTSNSDIAVFGTYWESSTYTGGTGIYVASTLGAVVALYGCTVYLTKLTFWVNGVSSTKLSLTGSGNKFIYANQGLTPALTTPFAYNLSLSSGDIDLHGDNWVDVFYNASNQPSGYTSNLWTAGAVANMDVKFPQGDQSSRDTFNYIGRNVLIPPTKYLSAGGLRVSEAANAKQGVATLVGGTVTVANTSITAASRIVLSIQSLGTVAAPKAIGVTARVVGTSFTITSADATDTSVVCYQIFEAA